MVMNVMKKTNLTMLALAGFCGLATDDRVLFAETQSEVAIEAERNREPKKKKRGDKAKFKQIIKQALLVAKDHDASSIKEKYNEVAVLKKARKKMSKKEFNSKYHSAIKKLIETLDSHDANWRDNTSA
jgi:hypothetical protein